MYNAEILARKGDGPSLRGRPGKRRNPNTNPLTQNLPVKRKGKLTNNQNISSYEDDMFRRPKKRDNSSSSESEDEKPRKRRPARERKRGKSSSSERESRKDKKRSKRESSSEDSSSDSD